MRDSGGRHHVERAGADRRRADHEATAEARLGVGDRGERHALLVVGAVGRQLVAHLVERLADAGDIAVAEDRPAPRRRSAASRRRRSSSAASEIAPAPAPSSSRTRLADHDLFLPRRATLAQAARCFLRTIAKSTSTSASNLRGHVVDGRVVVDLCRRASARAASAKIVRPTAKPLTLRRRSRGGEAFLQDAPSALRGRAARRRGTAGRALRSRRRSPPTRGRRLRLEFPPVRPEAGVVELGQRPRDRVVVERARLAGDDLDQEFAPDLARRLVGRDAAWRSARA